MFVGNREAEKSIREEYQLEIAGSGVIEYQGWGRWGITGRTHEPVLQEVSFIAYSIVRSRNKKMCQSH